MKFLKGLGLTICTIILFFTTLSLLVLVPLKFTIGKDNLKSLITNIDLEKEMTENSEIAGAIDELLAPIFDETEEFGIDKELVIKIVDSKEIKNLVGDVFANVINSVITGVDQKIINTDDIEELVNQAIDDINKTDLYEITAKERENILTAISDYADKYQDYIPDTSIINNNISAENQQVMNILRFIFGNILLTILIVVEALAILGFLALAHKNRKWILWSSIIILCAASLTSLIYILLKFFSGLLAKYSVQFIFELMYRGMNFGIILSIAMIILMIILIVFYSVGQKKKVTTIPDAKNTL